MKKTLYILTFVLFVTTSYSQKEYHNWVFGARSGITFNAVNEEPVYLGINKSIASENTSVISDQEGNLLYYSTENCLYNNLEKVQCSDSLLSGSWSSTQGSVLLSIDSSSFIRISSDFTVENQNDFNYVTFTIFNDKNGTINFVKTDTIFSEYKSENILAVKDFESKTFYLFLNDRQKGWYYTYKFNIENMNFEFIGEVQSNITYSPVIKTSIAGYLKSSLTGKYIVSCYNKYGFEVLKFDNTTEELKVIYTKKDSNDIYDGCYYSAEFSPNEKYLYYYLNDNRYKSTTVNRIQLYDESVNPNSEVVETLDNFSIGNMLLGPNFKIYISLLPTNYLSSIEQPDSNNAMFKTNSVSLKNSHTNWSLPNIPITYYNLLSLKDTMLICEGASDTIKSNLYARFKDTIYSWTGPIGYKSNSESAVINNMSSAKEGEYTLTVFNGDSSTQYTRYIYIKMIPEPTAIISAEPDSVVCYYEDVSLSIPDEYAKYNWTTNQKTASISASESGIYGVTYTNKNGCTGYTEINVTIRDKVNLDIIGPKEICKGSEEIYSSDGDYETYLWSNGDTTKTSEISGAGKYWLEITTAEGCTISDTIDITYHPNVIAELIPVSTTICEGDSVLLESKYDADYFEYLWSTNETTKSIYVSETGTYKLTITDTRTGCMDSTYIAISAEDNLQPTISGMNICDGNHATLEALPNDPSYTYEWSNGETTPTIVVNQPATYTVTVSKDGCTGTADFTVNESPNPEFEILGEDIVCGNTAMLTCSEDYAEYFWSTNEVTKEIEVTEAGTYSLTVTDVNGCQATEEFTVKTESLSFEILGEDIVCGNTAILTCSEDYAEYLWSTDEVTKEIEVTEAGTYSLTVTDENGCQATEEYTVNEQSLSFDISKDRIDFGKVYISETATDSATIINTSGFDITIQSGDEQYRILDGQTVQYNKTLNPTELGSYADSFEYRVISPCDTVITIPVTAEVYARVTISSDNIDTEIGKEESIPVYLKAKADLGEQTYTITTGIDQSVLFTEDEFTFTQTAPINESKTKIHEINGMIMLANELEYDITFPSYEFNNPYIEVIDRPGKINIDTICVFPLRTVTFIETTELRVSPNPAKDKLVVDVHSEENTIMTLELISSEGRVAYTENWTQTASEKQLNINTDKIPSGLYQVRLQTPSGVLTKNVIVVR